jgi:NAD(P)-dependent dehydrogenase (short-subunit alcohol dehydrogenase family)
MLGGQTAFVTGAGRGIGLAVAKELASRGANVALVARTKAQVDDGAAAIMAEGAGKALAFVVDVRDPAGVRQAAAATAAELGPITLLVNNAGTGGPAGLDWEVDADRWWECIESIVRGAFNCTRAVLPGMIARGGGRVVDMASVTGRRPGRS